MMRKLRKVMLTGLTMMLVGTTFLGSSSVNAASVPKLSFGYKEDKNGNRSILMDVPYYNQWPSGAGGRLIDISNWDSSAGYDHSDWSRSWFTHKGYKSYYKRTDKYYVLRDGTHRTPDKRRFGNYACGVFCPAMCIAYLNGARQSDPKAGITVDPRWFKNCPAQNGKNSYDWCQNPNIGKEAAATYKRHLSSSERGKAVTVLTKRYRIRDIKKVEEEILMGHPVMFFTTDDASGKSGIRNPFTEKWHYVVLTGYDERTRSFSVNNPNDRCGKRKTSRILGGPTYSEAVIKKLAGVYKHPETNYTNDYCFTVFYSPEVDEANTTASGMFVSRMMVNDD